MMTVRIVTDFRFDLRAADYYASDAAIENIRVAWTKAAVAIARALGVVVLAP